MKIQPLTVELLNKTFAYLINHEGKCVALMSHLYKANELSLPEKEFSYYVLTDKVENQEIICGVIGISKVGLVLHYIDNAEDINRFSLEIILSLSHILNIFPVYCILGESAGCKLLAKCVNQIPSRTINYTLMHFDSHRNSTSMDSIPKGFKLLRCSPSDVENLLPLQKQYDIVEVLISPEDFEINFCRHSLKKTLNTQIVYGLQNSNNTFVAKAGTNALGYKCVQIGGVFTLSEYRGMGFASFLVHKLAKQMEKESKETVLFVKNTNIAAQKAYIKAGFVPCIPFSIVYY